MKIAIVGSGISGLTCAWLLAPQHDITLLEAGETPGGHTHTVDVELEGQHWAIDTGFIVYNERTYPHFIGMLQELGVATQPTEMGFSMRCHATDFEYNGTSLAGLISDRRNLYRPRFYRMIRDILRFYRDTRDFLAALAGGQEDPSLTVAQFAARQRYSRGFLNDHLLPMGAAIWSCGLKQFGDFPFQFVARFYDHHGLIQVGQRPIWRVIQGGSREYVRKMLVRFSDRLRLQSPVQQITRTETGVELRSPVGTEQFDHVILACHSDTAIQLLAEPDSRERDLLSQFPYSRSVATLHTDQSILPRFRRTWASWNYALHPNRLDQPTLTYNMNILQGLTAPETFCVTLNSEDLIDPAKVLGRFEYSHPLFSESRDRAQQAHSELIGRRGISYCGAYWRNGFHEDGVVSALRVCAQWGIQPGWSDVPIDRAV